MGNTQLPSSAEDINQPLTLSYQESEPIPYPTAYGLFLYSALLETLTC